MTTSICVALEGLHRRMRDANVEASLIVHFDDRDGLDGEASAKAGVESFTRTNWPFGPPHPAIYYDPRTVAAGSSINLHAKCVVVDHRFVLIGCANFTHNAHARNIELGVLFDDELLACDVERQWGGLIDEGLLRRT